MIGLDTNVVVRSMVADDDVAQTTAVRTLFESLTPAQPAWISCVVLAETFWVLRRAYKHSSDDIVRALSVLVQAENFVIEQRDVVVTALTDASNGADFADALIVGAARRAGAHATVTFDARAARALEGMQLLER
jgi:predicted nucleic-acid-binding protein